MQRTQKVSEQLPAHVIILNIFYCNAAHVVSSVKGQINIIIEMENTGVWFSQSVISDVSWVLLPFIRPRILLCIYYALCKLQSTSLSSYQVVLPWYSTAPSCWTLQKIAWSVPDISWLDGCNILQLPLSEYAHLFPPMVSFKRVIVTPAVYPRFIEFLHFDIQSTGQKSHCVNIFSDHRNALF